MWLTLRSAFSSRRIARFLLAVGIVSFIGFLFAAGAIVIAGSRELPGHADLAVVLGNEVLSDGQPSPRLAARLDRAVDVYRQGDCPVILVSGGIEKNGFDEAKVMAVYLSAHGVPEAQIIQDNLGIDTYTTAQNTRRILREHGWRSVCVVTQFYHVPRARLALQKFGVSPVYSVHARYFEMRDFFSTAREVIGYVKYSFRRYPAVDARRAPDSAL